MKLASTRLSSRAKHVSAESTDNEVEFRVPHLRVFRRWNKVPRSGIVFNREPRTDDLQLASNGPSPSRSHSTCPASIHRAPDAHTSHHRDNRSSLSERNLHSPRSVPSAVLMSWLI